MRSIWKANIFCFRCFLTTKNIKFRRKCLGKNYRFGFFTEIPILGIFGLFFNPTYIVHDNNGKEIYRLKKNAFIFGRKFQLDQINDIADEDETFVVLSLMMMVFIRKNKRLTSNKNIYYLFDKINNL